MKTILKNMKAKIYFLSILFLSLFATSCSNDDDNIVQVQLLDIVESAKATEDFSSLVAALFQADAGLVELLQTNGPFTVFAPTNQAFSDLLDALGDDYNSLSDFDTADEKMLLADILKYHVVSGIGALSSDLSEGQTIDTALAGESITISLEGGVFIVDATDVNAQVITANGIARNGVVHAIDKVILPESVVNGLRPNIVELAQSVGDLSSLVDALIQADAGLVDLLQTDGPFTVFAPTNQAFADLLDTFGDDYTSLADFDTAEEKALLVDILTYHVVSGTAAYSTDLSDGQMIPTAQGESVTVSLTGGVFIDDAEVTGADNAAKNGVVHIINKIILPQSAIDALTPNIVELAQSVGDLSLLVDALIQADAGLVDLLQTDGPFTVFAPTNQAFADLLDTLGDDYTSLADFDTAKEKALLVDILTYHVVSGTAAYSTDLSDGQMIPTAQGESVTVSLTGGVFIDDAEVTGADNAAKNGVVHIINKIILPQSAIDALTPNIVELAQSVGDLSLLVDALIQADAGLVELLQTDGPFTVFAPTNQAFTDLLDTLGPDYNSLTDFDTVGKKALLADILTYHVVSGTAAYSTDLSDGQMIPTAQGESITVSLTGGVFIQDATATDAEVTGADNAAKNGVVHIINKIILPQAVVDAL